MTSIELERALIAGRKLLCAVSGGADSMCLLHLLWSEGFDVTAAHFEHGIRGEESRRDADFVRDFCAGHAIPLLLEHGDVPAYAEAQGLGPEEAARVLRYDFLRRCAAQIGAERIVTAHTLDDNAETILLNLARGCGAAGLRGIPRQNGAIVRPLLSVSRRDIEAYLSENSVPHIEDSSNQSDAYSRNRIRRQAVPALRSVNPRFDEAASRTAKLLERDEDCLSRLAGDFLAAQLRENSLPLEALRALHPAIASRVLRRMLPSLSQRHTDAALDFCAGEGYGLLDVPGGRLRREQGRLYFAPAGPLPLPARPLAPNQTLCLPEAGLCVRMEAVEYSGEIYDLFKTSYLKYEIVCSDLLCTGRLPGDRIRPLGRGCSKTLKDLFLEGGIPCSARESVPVLRDEEGPLLVYGLALAERAAPRLGERAWRITFTKYDEGEYGSDDTRY